jgi:hypothetical protein
VNLIRFVSNAPLSATDPLGLAVHFPPLNGRFTNASSAAVATIQGDFEALEVRLLGVLWLPVSFPRNWVEHFAAASLASVSADLRVTAHFVTETVAAGTAVPGPSTAIIDADFFTAADRTVYADKCCSKAAILPVKIGLSHLRIRDCPPTSGDPTGVFLE